MVGLAGLEGRGEGRGNHKPVTDTGGVVPTIVSPVAL